VVFIKRTKYNKELFIEKANKVHKNKYDYSLVEFQKSNIPIKILCTIHNEFLQKPKDHIAGKGCKGCAIDLTIKRNANFKKH
jgi:hypothetical protein